MVDLRKKVKRLLRETAASTWLESKEDAVCVLFNEHHCTLSVMSDSAGLSTNILDILVSLNF